MRLSKRFVPLGLTVGNVGIQPPDSVKHISSDKVGFLGGNIIQLFINLLLLTAAVLSLFYLIWGAIEWIMSGGDKHGVESAQNKIKYAVIGLIIAFSSFAIMNVLGAFFRVDLFAK